MKLINKILLWVLIIAVVIFLVSAVLVALFGKKIIERQLQERLKAKTSFKSVSLRIPFSINISGLEIENLFSAKSISFYPNIPALLSGKIILHNLNIRGGQYIFTDKRNATAGFQTMFKNINASVARVTLPITSLNTQFKADADIATATGETLGEATSSGWVDLMEKNLDADLEVKDLEIIYFAPYYGNFISERKILSAKVNLASKLKAENNDLEIDSHFRLSNLIYAQEGQIQEQWLPSLDLVKNALDLFTDKKGNLELEFSLKTKLDRPNISVEQFKKVILEAAMRNLANQPLDQTIDKVQQTIKQFEDFGKEMQKIFKGKE